MQRLHEINPYSAGYQFLYLALSIFYLYISVVHPFYHVICCNTPHSPVDGCGGNLREQGCDGRGMLQYVREGVPGDAVLQNQVT